MLPLEKKKVYVAAFFCHKECDNNTFVKVSLKFNKKKVTKKQNEPKHFNVVIYLANMNLKINTFHNLLMILKQRPGC